MQLVSHELARPSGFQVAEDSAAALHHVLQLLVEVLDVPVQTRQVRCASIVGAALRYGPDDDAGVGVLLLGLLYAVLSAVQDVRLE